jgi:hypothetical protein
MNDLQSAIDSLGAVEVFRMDPVTASQHDRAQELAARRYAYRQPWEPDSRWHIVSARWLLAEWGDDKPSGEMPIAMPTWWSPERRFAVGASSTKLSFATRDEAANAFLAPHTVWTADLETGKEIPA